MLSYLTQHDISVLIHNLFKLPMKMKKRQLNE